MTYHVFVDDRVSRDNVAALCVDSAYDASAVANLMDDRGFRVFTDLHGETVRDAMVSPQAYTRYELGRVELLGTDT